MTRSRFKPFSTGRLLPVAACWLLNLLLAGCLQPVDYELPVDRKATASPVSWKLAGSFGGPAQLSVESEDPWQQRYAAGGFLRIAGLCVTEREVWVCDLGISRIQIFGYDGDLLRSVGEGVPLAGTLISDEELYDELKRPPRDPRTRWETLHGAKWAGQQGRLFKAADVAVADGGYYIADWAQTGSGPKPRRDAGVYFVADDGRISFAPSHDIVWPRFLACENDNFALSEPDGNALFLGQRTDDRWPVKCLTAPTRFDRIMEVRQDANQGIHYWQSLNMAAQASGDRGKFNGLGGIAMAFDKLIACDRNNIRLQVYDARRDNPQRWGWLIRIITPKAPDGTVRFVVPADVDVSAAGDVFVLDAERLEVAQLNPRFERVGSLARGDLAAPIALDVSPDGRDCFICDVRTNMVMHYERVD